jgi:serine phosphatase RsbU (regulator of sigma subunit)
MLVGVHVGATRRDHVVTVPRGSTFVFYTDGLVERRDQLFDDGIHRLAAELPALGGLPTEELADALLARLVPTRAEDDVALIAVRLTVQDGAA